MEEDELGGEDSLWLSGKREDRESRSVSKEEKGEGKVCTAPVRGRRWRRGEAQCGAERKICLLRR